jgi:hypothetical protein
LTPTRLSHAIHLKLEMSDDLARLRLPPGVPQRLTALLDQQDAGITRPQTGPLGSPDFAMLDS